MDAKIVQRRFDLDWLRVLGFSAVFLYHSGRFFDSAGWHVKNATSSPVADILKSIFDLWGMPLLFLISGASIFFALRPGRETRFLWDRVKRLLVPLALGILVLAPPQMYLTRLSHGEFQGSLLDFLPVYFKDWGIWGGNFAWSGVHLWFLEDLFLFTLVLLPIFIALKRPAGRRLIDGLARLAARPFGIFLWLVPFAVLAMVTDPLGIAGPGLSEDLSRLVVFPFFVLYGYLIFADDRVQQAIIRQRRTFLALAVVLTLAAPFISAQAAQNPGLLTLLIVIPLVGIVIWTSILAILGYGMRYLTANHRLLSYANEAVLPIYVLHQPVILLIGYFVIPLALPILAKYSIILSLAFGITLGLYEFLVRRNNVIRILFGLKPLGRPATDARAVLAVGGV